MIKKCLLGLLTGLATGFFASGGGMILVPGLVYIIGLKEKEARATALGCILPSVIVSSIFYYRGDFLDLKMSLMAAVGGIVGALIGQKVLYKLSDNFLKLLLIVFLIYFSIKYIFGI